MTTYGIDDGALSYNAKPMKDYITTTQPSLDAENETDDFTTLGSSVEKSIYTGLTKYGEMPIGGPFDDTGADGSDAVFGGAARAKSYAALIITWGGSKTTTFSAVGVKNYKRIIAKSSITNYEAVMFLGPGCTVTEA